MCCDAQQTNIFVYIVLSLNYILLLVNLAIISPEKSSQSVRLYARHGRGAYEFADETS